MVFYKKVLFSHPPVFSSEQPLIRSQIQSAGTTIYMVYCSFRFSFLLLCRSQVLQWRISQHPNRAQRVGHCNGDWPACGKRDSRDWGKRKGSELMLLISSTYWYLCSSNGPRAHYSPKFSFLFSHSCYFENFDHYLEKLINVLPWVLSTFNVVAWCDSNS